MSARREPRRGAALAPTQRGGERRGLAAPRAMARHYVHAGQLVTAAGVAEISTILGTCVAICLWDEELGVGGMNHYLLPFPASDTDVSARFGAPAFELLLRALEELGARRRRLRAKVFGGMQARLGASRDDDLGRENAELASRLLAEAGIPIVAKDVGGVRGRKLVFELPSGEAFVKYL